MQFTIDYTSIRKLLELNHFPMDSATSSAFFIAIRGAVPSDPDSWRNFHLKTDFVLSSVDYIHYNCTIIQVRDGKLSAFRGTTLPGIWYVNHPLHAKGAARLLEGCHTLRQGYHKESDVRKRYPAFCQHEAFPLLRDTNANLEFNRDTDWLSIVKDAGINLHYGKGDLIGKWGAGCQVINTDNQLRKWNTFKERVYSGRMDTSKTYSYYLFNADYVSNFSNAKSRQFQKYERLLWGSKGDRVKTLQKRLLEIGFQVWNSDGDFGPRTMRDGVMAFQRKFISPKKADGIVTDDVWKIIFSVKSDRAAK
jgi:hypothetical protein